MKKIIHHYGADLEWVDSLAEKFEGKIDGNFIIVPEHIHTGHRYYLDCGMGIVALYIDVMYHTEIELTMKNKNKDFIGLYYNLSEGNSKLTLDSVSKDMGILSYNLSVFDSALEFQYNVKAGTKTFILCIFIKKEIMNSFTQKDIALQQRIDQISYQTKNTLIDWGRMSNQSEQAIIDLRKLKVGGTQFDLNLIGTVYLLISDYLRKISDKDILIQLSNQPDLPIIISIQKFLMENLKNHFPGNKTIALKFNISVSKFKVLFKKITGQTANDYFMENKLIKAKELLEKKELSVEEVSKQFNFTDQSYFALKFKKYFGLAPKKYIKQL